MLKSQPYVRSQLMLTIAQAYVALGRLSEGEGLLKRVVDERRRLTGEDSADTARALHELASVYILQNRPDEALPLYQRAVAIFRRELGNDHGDTLSGVGGASSPFTLTVMRKLAQLLHTQGRDADAAPIAREAVANGNPNTVGTISSKKLLDEIEAALAKAKDR